MSPLTEEVFGKGVNTEVGSGRLDELVDIITTDFVTLVNEASGSQKQGALAIERIKKRFLGFKFRDDVAGFVVAGNSLNRYNTDTIHVEGFTFSGSTGDVRDPMRGVNGNISSVPEVDILEGFGSLERIDVLTERDGFGDPKIDSIRLDNGIDTALSKFSNRSDSSAMIFKLHFFTKGNFLNSSVAVDTLLVVVRNKKLVEQLKLLSSKKK